MEKTFVQKVSEFEEKIRTFDKRKLVFLIPIVLLFALLPLLFVKEDQKERTLIDDARDLMSASEENCTNEDKLINIVFGKITDSDFEYEGPVPDSGQIAIAKNCDVAIAVHDGTSCAMMYFGEEELKMSTFPRTECMLGANVFDDKLIIDKINEGFIPITSAKELRKIGSEEEHIFAEGRKYETTLKADMNGKYFLVNDIELNEEWTPIGNEENPFTGEIDGEGYTIKNIKISFIKEYEDEELQDEDDETLKELEEFFDGYLDERDTYVDWNSNKGIFGYVNEAKFENINFIVDIEASSYVGGIIARADEVTINNVTVSGKIKGTDRIGGFVGYGENVKINDSTSSVSVEGKSYVAGFVGTATNAFFERSIVSGKIKGELIISGFIGDVNNISIKNCYSKAEVTSISYVAGFIGISDINSGIIENSYSIATIQTEADNFAHFNMGTPTGFQIVNSFYGVEEVDAIYSDISKTFTDMKKKSSFENWDFENTWKIEEGKSYPTLR